MQEVVLFFSGAFIGLLVYYLPTVLWLNQDGGLSDDAFKSAYPKKKYVYYLYKLLPVIWLFIYSLLIFPEIARLFQSGNLILYFVGYLLLGGFGALDGLAELVTGVAPIRPGSGARGSLGLGYLVVNNSVRRAGFLRLGLATGIGLLSWVIIVVVF
jgi:hypothetical protein